MKKLVDRNNKPVAKAAGVQPEHLPSPLHPQLAGALRPAADDGHIVDAVVVGRHKGDTGRSAGNVVHGLPHRGLVSRWKSVIELVLNYPTGPQQVRVGKVSVKRVSKRWISEIADHYVAFKRFLDGW